MIHESDISPIETVARCTLLADQNTKLLIFIQLLFCHKILWGINKRVGNTITTIRF